MAIYLEVFLERSKLPTFAAWSEAITKEGFPLSFPQAVDLAKHMGYLPAIFRNEESGFEFSISELTKSEEVPSEVLSILPAADVVANFRFHEMHECLAATVAASVLVSLTKGVFSDPQDGSQFLADEAISQARLAMDAALKAEDVQASTRPEKLSPAKWARAFEETLQQVHSDYRLTKKFRGRLVECVREDVNGLYLSQNCVNVHDTYRHCFAILFTRIELSEALYSPFVLGSRFDHNSTISHAYNRDYRAGMKWQVAPKEWHSEYRSTVRATRQWVESTANSAEHVLRPFYLSRLSHGAERVAALFQDAALFIKQWGASETTLRQPEPNGALAVEFANAFNLSSPPSDWDERLVAYFNALCLADANGFSGIRLLKHRRGAMNIRCDDIALASERFLSIPSDIRHAALFTAYVEDFLAVQSELPKMLAMIENVKDSYPQSTEKPADSDRPWWKLW